MIDLERNTLLNGALAYKVMDKGTETVIFKISSAAKAYLDEIAAASGRPKVEYMRLLLQRDMLINGYVPPKPVAKNEVACTEGA